ncbi:hypothetical protein OQA88_496 [Cercophora sp. LCS_1]
MSLYHETASLLSAPKTHGGSLKSRVFSSSTSLKSPPAQIYALALESAKWSPILAEIIDASRLLSLERKLTPILSLLLVHDLLLSKKGIALPASHGLRLSVERHRARLTSELTRSRLRRKCATLDALREMVEGEHASTHPRWVRVNTLKSSVDGELETLWKGWEVVASVGEVMNAKRGERKLCLDGNVEGLVALPPGSDVTRSESYREGRVILQDKASCFPAVLLDPRGEMGEVVDATAAPGNKTTHLAAILGGRGVKDGGRVWAFEKDERRKGVLEKMVKKAGAGSVVVKGGDFLKTRGEEYPNVGGLLLDPSCSGSGIVGREDLPELCLPEGVEDGGNKKTDGGKKTEGKGKKRKRDGDAGGREPVVLVDDDGETTVVGSEKDLKDRIEALAAFQLSVILHAFTFPAARRVTYSTCSIYAGENEHVVLKALASDVARERGWRILKREGQVRGMQEWPVRGDVDACDGNVDVAEGCIRTYRDDGRGVMGFFVAGFVRDMEEADDDEGPFVRDADGRIIRDEMGIPTLKATGKKAVDLDQLDDSDDESVEYHVGPPGGDGKDNDEGPYVRDAEGRIVRDAMGMPTLKSGPGLIRNTGDDEWDGFDD